MPIANTATHAAKTPAAPKPPKAAGTSVNKSGAPRAPKGPSLVWTSGKGSMDAVLVNAARTQAAEGNGLVYIGPLVDSLKSSPLFADAVAAGTLTQAKVSSRIAKLRAFGVILPKSGRNRSQVDVAGLNEGVEAELAAE